MVLSGRSVPGCSCVPSLVGGWKLLREVLSAQVSGAGLAQVRSQVARFYQRWIPGWPN